MMVKIQALVFGQYIDVDGQLKAPSFSDPQQMYFSPL
jgi:hypothetical protein